MSTLRMSGFTWPLRILSMINSSFKEAWSLINSYDSLRRFGKSCLHRPLMKSSSDDYKVNAWILSFAFSSILVDCAFDFSLTFLIRLRTSTHVVASFYESFPSEHSLNSWCFSKTSFSMSLMFLYCFAYSISWFQVLVLLDSLTMNWLSFLEKRESSFKKSKHFFKLMYVLLSSNLSLNLSPWTFASLICPSTILESS